MINKIKGFVENGYSSQKIARKVNLSSYDVRKIIKEYKFSIKFEEFLEDKIPYILDLYKDGVPARSLGIKYKIDKKKVLLWAKEKGILRGVFESRRTRVVNEYIFDNIDSEEKAYWLGFLYADAYNNEKSGAIKLSLQGRDIEHIKKYVKFVGGDFNDIKTGESKLNNKIYTYCKYSIFSKHMSIKLKELGCPQAKSFIIEYPYWLDKSLTFHFIRGYFDGDGCISFAKNRIDRFREWIWSVLGTDMFCKSLQDIFLEKDILLRLVNVSKTGHNTSSLSCSGNVKVKKISDLLYKTATIYLERKYQKYLILIDQNKKVHPGLDKKSFHDYIFIDNMKMEPTYLKKLSEGDRIKLIEPISEYFIINGMVCPDDIKRILYEFNIFNKYKPNLSTMNQNNMSSMAVYICQFFCKSFYNAKLNSCSKSIYEAFFDKEILKDVIRSKIGFTKSKIEGFSPQIIIESLIKFGKITEVNIFKPPIAKFMYLKYSNEGDTVGDYSCGFGERFLAAMCCKRKYIGTDPLTIPEIKEMANFFDFENYKLIKKGSEFYKGKENSLDLSWSSPPCYNSEIYSNNIAQAYNNGEDYFYNEYWDKTLKNIKYMLKPDKWFGINVNKENIIMMEIAKKYFGDIIEEVKLLSHSNEKSKVKTESIYMFKNKK